MGFAEGTGNLTTENEKNKNEVQRKNSRLGERFLMLKSHDSQLVEVPRRWFSQSKLITNLLADLGLDSEVHECPTVSLEISGATLKKVVSYAEYHMGDASDSETAGREPNTDDLCSWDRQFLKLDQANLFEIILAANYLEMPNLLAAGCKTVAAMMKGKSVEEIRQVFNVNNDFTPEEEEENKKQNAWCEE